MGISSKLLQHLGMLQEHLALCAKTEGKDTGRVHGRRTGALDKGEGGDLGQVSMVETAHAYDVRGVD